MTEVMTEVMWTCCDEEVYTHSDLIAHLQKVHGLTPPIEATQKMVMSLDDLRWSLNTYEIRIGELVLHKSVKTIPDPGTVG